jgi:hypothetical protein
VEEAPSTIRHRFTKKWNPNKGDEVRVKPYVVKDFPEEFTQGGQYVIKAVRPDMIQLQEIKEGPRWWPIRFFSPVIRTASGVHMQASLSKIAVSDEEFYSFYALSLVPRDYWESNPYHAAQAAELLNGMWKEYRKVVFAGIAREIYNAYKRRNIDYDDYLDVAKNGDIAKATEIFSNPRIWKGLLKGYGGKKWADISKLVQDIDATFPVSGGSLPDGFILLDMLHDLEHNTDLVLSEYYPWIQVALDHKRGADPQEILNMALPRYKSIVMESGAMNRTASKLDTRDITKGKGKE